MTRAYPDATTLEVLKAPDADGSGKAGSVPADSLLPLGRAGPAVRSKANRRESVDGRKKGPL